MIRAVGSDASANSPGRPARAGRRQALIPVLRQSGEGTSVAPGYADAQVNVNQWRLAKQTYIRNSGPSNSPVSPRWTLVRSSRLVRSR